jgi:hypothetical protein
MNTNAYMANYMIAVTTDSCNAQCERCMNLQDSPINNINNKACVDCTRCRPYITNACASNNTPVPRDMFMDTRHSNIQYVPTPLMDMKKRKNKKVREVFEPNVGMCFMCSEDQMKCRRITSESEKRRLLYFSPVEERETFDRYFVENADGVRNFINTR